MKSMEAPAGHALRIAVFTHDTYGLGHVRRCLRILHALSEASPESALLLITGSPAVQSLGPLPRNTDWVKIPTVVRTGAPASRPPHLPIALREVTRLRRRLVQAALTNFAPDVLLIDNFPLGSRRELLPILTGLRKRSTQTVLGLRDIVDHPETVREHWRRDGIYEVLDRLYDRILVYGNPGVLDVAEAYRLPAETACKLRYCGYITPSADAEARTPVELGLGSPLALVTVGGGGDGLPLLRASLAALERLPELSAIVVTGSLMSASDRESLGTLRPDPARIHLREHVPDLTATLAAADVVVSMSGYNTVAEILGLRRPAVLVPRTWRYGEHARRFSAADDGEQLLRAQALEKAGLAEVVHPDALDPDLLADRIRAALRRGPPGRPDTFDTRGLERVTAEILALIRRAGEAQDG